jgi:REP element-mobilizing transposase RayT
MNKNFDIYRWETLRLQNYDYLDKGLYFITISIKDKLCLFWDIKNDKITLFESWKMIEENWLNLEKEFKNIILHKYVVMPNHFHWIIEIIEKISKCDCNICNDISCDFPNTDKYSYNMQKNYFLLDDKDINKKWINIKDTHKGCPYNRNSIGNIIWKFKSKTTVKYVEWVYEKKWPIFNKKLWQKDFYEHIIRNDKSYSKISEYIEINPIKWKEDKFYYTEI